MALTTILRGLVCWARRHHSWGEWEPAPYEHLRDVKRCACGVERHRRRGLT